MLLELSEGEARERIARRAAAELRDGEVVNLGIGIPQLVPRFLPQNIRVILQTENGVINARASDEKYDLRVIDAGGTPVSAFCGGAFISSEESFALMRGGHIDVTILGALEADKEGNLANWAVPGQRVPGMGGAMDIAVGAKKVCVATRCFDKTGKSKLVGKCSLPLTARGVVSVIITEYCVVKNIKGVMTVTEIADDADMGELLPRIEMKPAKARNIKRTKF